MRWRPRRERGPRTRSRAGAWRAFLAAYWPFVLGALLVAAGLGAIVLGYLGAAGTLVVGLQVPYVVSGAILGLALVVLGTGLLVVHSTSRQARLTRRLLDEIRAAPPRGGAGGGNGSERDGFVVVRGGRSFHRPDCLLVRDKDVRRVRADATRRLSPCRVCEPAA